MLFVSFVCVCSASHSHATGCSRLAQFLPSGGVRSISGFARRRGNAGPSMPRSGETLIATPRSTYGLLGSSRQLARPCLRPCRSR